MQHDEIVVVEPESSRFVLGKYPAYAGIVTMRLWVVRDIMLR